MVAIFPNVCLWRRSYSQNWEVLTLKNIASSHLHMPVRPTLLHRMALVSFLLFRKNLGNLREFFGQKVYRPPWQKIARTPMNSIISWVTDYSLIVARNFSVKFKISLVKLRPWQSSVRLSGAKMA